MTCDTELSVPRDGGPWDKRDYESLKGLEPLLGVLGDFEMSGLFFVEGKIAKEKPKAVEEIYSRGHEVGCHGYAHGSYGGQVKVSTPEPPLSLNMVERKEQLEKATSTIANVVERPTSFRAPFLSVDGRTLTILEDFNYDVDSSINNTIYGVQGSYHPSLRCVHKEGEAEILENPIAVAPSWLGGSSFPSFLPVTDLVYAGKIELAVRYVRFWYRVTGGEPVNLITHVQDFRDEKNWIG